MYFKDKVDSVRESTAATPLYDVITGRLRHCRRRRGRETDQLRAE